MPYRGRPQVQRSAFVPLSWETENEMMYEPANLPREEGSTSSPRSLINPFAAALGNSPALRQILDGDSGLAARGRAHCLSGSEEAVRAAAIEMPAVLARYALLDTLIRETESSAQTVWVTQALLFLHARASEHKRTFSDERSFEHSLRVANDFLKIVDGKITDRAFLVRGVAKALMHDMIEDFKTSHAEIQRVFDKNVADDTVRMTTPSTYDLAALFPGIVTPIVLRQVEKAKDTETYNAFAAQLKLHSKCSEAKEFELDEVIVKSVDNADSLSSYTRDIVRGNIKLYPVGSFRGKPAKGLFGPIGVSMVDELRNIRDRTTYQVFAIMPRLDHLKEESGTTLPPATIDAIRASLHGHFWNTRDDYAAHVESTPLLPPLRQAWIAVERALSRGDRPLARPESDRSAAAIIGELKASGRNIVSRTGDTAARIARNTLHFTTRAAKRFTALL